MTPLPAGPDGQVLTADSTAPTGLKYAPAGAGSDVYAATRVVSLIAGDGTDLTVAAAIAALPAAGGRIYVKQGTYPLAATLTMPDKPVVIEGSGEGTIFDLGANAIAAFTVPNGLTTFRQYVFQDFKVIGTSIAAQKIVSIQDENARGLVDLIRLKSEAVQIAVDITDGDTSFVNQIQLTMEDCWFVPIAANTGALVSLPDLFFGVELHADRVKFFDVEFGAQGGSLAKFATPGVFPNFDAYFADSIFNVALDSTFGTLYMENCSIWNATVGPTFLNIYSLGSASLLSTSALIAVFALSNILIGFSEAVSVVGGDFTDVAISTFGTSVASEVTGATFRIGPNLNTAINTAGRFVHVDGCIFSQNAPSAGNEYINILVVSGGAQVVSNCLFREISGTGLTAIDIINTAADTFFGIYGCFFDSPNLPPWIEEAGTNNCHYGGNVFTSDSLAPQIIGTNSRVDGVQAGDARSTDSIAFGWGRMVSRFLEVGNIGGGTDDLQTFTIPANTLNVNGRTIRVKAWGRTANNGDSKTVTMEFGGQTIMTQALTDGIAGTWRIDAEIIKTGPNTQRIFAELLQLTTLVQKQTATAGVQTDTSAIVIKCTGTATTIFQANDNIVQEGMIVEIS